MNKLLILAIFIFIPFIENAQGQIQSDNSIMVEGLSITKEQPELIELSLDVNCKSHSFSSCSDSLMIIINSITKTLVKNGINKDLIHKSGISVTEDYKYISGKNVKVGFYGKSRIEISDLFSDEFKNAIFKSISDFQYEVKFNIQFSLSEVQKEKLRKNSLEEAINDAFEKAQIIAKQSQLELGNINKITVVDQNNRGYKGVSYDLVKENVSPGMRSEQYNSTEFNPEPMAIIKRVVIEWQFKLEK